MISTSNDLYTLQRELEVVTEAFESLEQTATYNEVSSKQIGNIMVPLCLNLGNIIDKLQQYRTEKDSAPVHDFVTERGGKPQLNLVITDRENFRRTTLEE